MEYEYIENSGYPRRKLPYVTIFFIVVNVVVFLVVEIGGSTDDADYLYECGAMYWPSVLEGEYYRFLASMFLHSGTEHLLNNMFMLGILGYQMEEEYGRIKYFITYMLSGLCGSLISGLFEMFTGQYSIGVGASGAVFGIFGAMLVMMFKNRKQAGQNSGLRLLILFVLAVFGNMQEGVDWVAHFGGALTGAAMSFMLYRPKHKRMIEL